MSKLSIAIDMGAKNNGVFIVKNENDKILDKKATNIVVDKINFSKKSRTLKRHQKRNINRYKLVRRLFEEIVNLENHKQVDKNKNYNIEKLIGLLHNRGFDRTEGSFERLDELVAILLKNYTEIKSEEVSFLSTLDNFEIYINSFENQVELKNQMQKYLNQIDKLLKDIQNFINKKEIIKDLKSILNKEIPREFKKHSYIKNLYKSNDIEYIKNIKEEKGTKDFIYKLKAKDFEIKIKEQQIYLNEIILKKEIDYIENLHFEENFIDETTLIYDNLKLNNNDKENDTSITRKIVSVIEALNSGAKPRKMYQKDIRRELFETKEMFYKTIDSEKVKSQRLKFYFLTDEERKFIYQIVCHLSNLQLRVLRKYFNNKFDNKLDEKKLSIVVYKYFISKHYSLKFEKNRRIELFRELNKYINLKKLSKSTMETRKNYNYYDDRNSNYNIIDFFQNCNPEYTIPPYEDMNNRNTYKCNTLYINPINISKNLENYINKLIKKNEFSIIVNNFNPISKKDYAFILQRILDSKKLDISKEIYPRDVFKHQRNGTNIKFYQDISKDEFLEFSNFAKDYYKNEEKALNGIFDNKNLESFFIKCNTNTPAKKTIKHELINTIFNTTFKNDEVDNFKIKLETLKIKNKKVSTIIEDINNIYKSYQNSFFKNLSEANYYKQYDSSKFETVDDELKSVLSHIEILKDSIIEVFKSLNQSSYLNNTFSFDEEKSISWNKKGKNLSRFINSILQIHNILFTDTKGHNKTCRKCTIENNFRSNETNPLAKRLLSDVAKPINGKLDMMLKRIATEIISNLDDNLLKNIENIDILLEQNKFKFEESLIDLNIKKDKNKKSKKVISKICPYTGKTFDISSGEYDHILPQSISRNSLNQVFNSEANLIYCSREGNKNKANQIYTFKNLNEKHLLEVFGETKEKIKETIREIWRKSNGLKYYTNFRNLSKDEQLAFRYSLFFNEDEEEFKKAKKLLETTNQTISNGTQKRLAKLIFEKLPKNIDVNVKVIDSKIVSEIREELSIESIDNLTGEIKYYPNTSKEHTRNNDKSQTAFSHIVDAMVVYHIANKNSFEIFHNLKNDFNSDLDYTQLISTKHWYETSNSNYKIESKKLFDENDIGVSYLKIRSKLIKDNKGKDKTIFEKGINTESFVKSSITESDFKYFIKNSILKEKVIFKNKNEKIIYEVDKNTLYEKLFNNKDEVLDNINHYKKIEDLRYTYIKVNPFDFLNKFLEPSTIDDKKAVSNIVENTRPTLADITTKNLMTWFGRANKLDKNGAKLGYYNSWLIFSNIIVENKNELFKKVKKEIKNGDSYEYLEFNISDALELCKHKLFKQTHIKRRNKIKNEYSLYSASKNDTQYVHRKKNKDGDFIYQTRIANGHNKLKGFIKGFTDDGKYFFENSKNIIPLTMKNYQKAFKKTT